MKLCNPFLISGLLFFGILFVSIPPLLWGQVQPTPAEIKFINKQVQQTFLEFIQLWQEERYFEMYELGKTQTRVELSPEDFATRMVQLDWVPTKMLDDPAMKISFRFRSLIYVNASLEFRHKSKEQLSFTKPLTFLLLLEDGAWKFDLIQMVRSPFYVPNPEAL